MRIFFIIYALVLGLRWATALYFSILALTTAPEDTSELLREGAAVIEWLNSNPVLDLTLLVIGLFGLALAFGWGNWRLAIHRLLSKSKLERLEAEARRVAEDVANTISQENQRRSSDMARDFDLRSSGSTYMRHFSEQDQRYLSKHMMEAASIIRRLDEVGYWRPTDFMHEIGIAGATSFAAEVTCKELYTAADRIKSDLQDGIISVVTRPPSQ